MKEGRKDGRERGEERRGRAGEEEAHCGRMRLSDLHPLNPAQHFLNDVISSSRTSPPSALSLHPCRAALRLARTCSHPPTHSTCHTWQNITRTSPVDQTKVALWQNIEHLVEDIKIPINSRRPICFEVALPLVFLPFHPLLCRADTQHCLAANTL